MILAQTVGPHPPARAFSVEERQPPDEEADGGRVQDDAGPAGAADQGQRLRGRRGALRPPGRRLPRGPLPPGAPRGPRRPGPGPPYPRPGPAAGPGREGLRLLSTRAPAPRTWPPPWPSSAWSRTSSATRRRASAGCRSSPTRRAPSAWRACSPPSASTRRRARRYEPVDRDQLMYYKEAKNGQILNEGITEAGSMADFIAASTSYATHGEAMIPFYIFYSMFGWQRTADQMWQLGDQLGRGFPHRRDGGPYDPDGRGPAARRRPLPGHRRHQPGRADVRPRVRLRDRGDRP